MKAVRRQSSVDGLYKNRAKTKEKWKTGGNKAECKIKRVAESEDHRSRLCNEVSNVICGNGRLLDRFILCFVTHTPSHTYEYAKHNLYSSALTIVVNVSSD